MDQFIDEIIRYIKTKKPGKIKLSQYKAKLSKKYKLLKIPTDIEILLNSPIKDVDKVWKYLATKPTRTISGVAVCAIMTKPGKCPHVKSGIGPCLMCPGGPGSVFGNVPQSYTGKEPATRRAIRNNYDPYFQVMNRLEQYIVQGHIPDKLELIIMGGTFISCIQKYQEDFVKYAFCAMNDFSNMFFVKNKLDIVKFKNFFELPGDINSLDRLEKVRSKIQKLKNKQISLITEQKKNEKSFIRCVSLVIETRPDYANLKYANQMLKLGCTKVELGVQTIYDDVLKTIRRGHTVQDSVNSTKILKDLGFKINYHIMPGLPGVDKKKDIMAFQALFAYEDFRPDMLKLYPCMVLKGTKLYGLWKKKKYKPLTTKKAALLIAEFKRYVPKYCRIMRVQRDIPSFVIEAGVDKTNLRQYVSKILTEKKIKCDCIRCREPKLTRVSNKIILSELHYIASEGNEFFICAEDVKNNLILGFCRLRFPSDTLRKEITGDSALIRELHVYGASVQIGKKGKVQHKGIGKALVERAEQTAKTYNKDKVVVISGVGAREYFRKIGYKKEGPYMVKLL
ncbi:MAG: tRNA uridine(34) 5-carboxymethylaminomethyl modification radical SAM/GNAT enzyme Elp3 [Nanoarchaeota archaeon]